MDYTELNHYKEKLHQQTLTEILQKNEEQTKILTNYQNKHKSVVEGLEILPLELSTNCLIPIGKQALMPGKLQHTNEILVCLGDGYFVEYSAAQAIELAKRRIKHTEEILKRLQEEKNLFESRQNIPLNFGAFGDDVKEELLEHWDDEELEKWRVEHRQRVKEYHEKKSQQKEEQKYISTEEELFRRLDELELEEELADEYYRSHENEDDDSDQEEGDEEDENDEDDEIDDKGDELNEEEKEIRREYEEHNEMEKQLSNEKTEALMEETANFSNLQLNEVEKSSTSQISSILPSSEETSSVQADISSKDVVEENSLKLSNAEPEKKKNKDKRVSFRDTYDSFSSDMSDDDTSKKSVTEFDVSDEHINYEKDVENVTVINFSHSDVRPQMTERVNSIVNDPGDILKTFFKPKSILKRSKNDLNTPVPDQYKFSESENIGSSVYDDVVTRIVHEKNKEVVNPEPTEPIIKKKPVSRFRLERATLNK